MASVWPSFFYSSCGRSRVFPLRSRHYLGKGTSMANNQGNQPQAFVLPKDALARINLGQTFAENDKILLLPNVFVKTPASQAALEPSRSKCFFVGRRGTGKTAISTYLTSQRKNVVQ